MSSTEVATDARLMAAVGVGEDLQGTNGEADDNSSNNNNTSNNTDAYYYKRSNKCRLVLYWVGFVLTIAVVVFLSGAFFSCHAFDKEDLVYGFRGFIHNDTNECTSWEEHKKTKSYNEEWYGYFQTLFYMGIAAVALSVIALAVWIMEAIVWVRTDSSLQLLRITFAVAIAASGILSFMALILNCDNIPPLAEGGVDCHLTAWTVLGFFASLSACATAFIPCLFGICPLPYYNGMRQRA